MARPKFTNETYLDFSDKKNINRMQKALAEVEKNFGKEYPLIINGERIFTESKFPSTNPSFRNQVVGYFSKANKELAEKAVLTAYETFDKWKKVPPEKRAKVLFRAADIIRRRRFEINAWMISEVGKNWLEADADTCEAIDFLEFYGREMLRYAQKQPLTKVKGEINELVYLPLGVGVVIPPWNFPFAILVGMTSASIVTGNTVVLKPSSDSPMMGYLLRRLWNKLDCRKEF